MDKKLNIAIVLNTAWNIYNFRLGLVQAFIEAGHVVFAVAPRDEFVPQVEAAGAIFVPVENLSRKGMNPIQDMRYSYELFTIYKKYAIDIALQYTIKPNIYGSMASRASKTKTISTVTGLGYSFMSEGIVNSVAKRLYKTAFVSCDLVAFQNSDDKLLFEELGLCSQNKTALIKGSGIKTDYFCPLPKTEETDKLVFLFVGRLLFDKGVAELFEAAKMAFDQQLPIEFWVVGGVDEGNPSAIDKKLVEEYHKKGIINYIGHSNDVRSIMQNADVVVLPSYREGLPRVMLESLSMAKPVITTNAPGCKEVVIDKENGFIVPVKDAMLLYEAIAKMAALTEEERLKMGKKGRQMALDVFDERVIIQRYFEEIARLID